MAKFEKSPSFPSLLTGYSVGYPLDDALRLCGDFRVAVHPGHVPLPDDIVGGEGRRQRQRHLRLHFHNVDDDGDEKHNTDEITSLRRSWGHIKEDDDDDDEADIGNARRRKPVVKDVK